MSPAGSSLSGASLSEKRSPLSGSSLAALLGIGLKLGLERRELGERRIRIGRLLARRSGRRSCRSCRAAFGGRPVAVPARPVESLLAADLAAPRRRWRDWRSGWPASVRAAWSAPCSAGAPSPRRRRRRPHPPASARAQCFRPRRGARNACRAARCLPMRPRAALRPARPPHFDHFRLGWRAAAAGSAGVSTESTTARLLTGRGCRILRRDGRRSPASQPVLRLEPTQSATSGARLRLRPLRARLRAAPAKPRLQCRPRPRRRRSPRALRQRGPSRLLTTRSRLAARRLQPAPARPAPAGLGRRSSR